MSQIADEFDFFVSYARADNVGGWVERFVEARLGLATGILIASSLGIIIGIELTTPVASLPNTISDVELNLFSDMILAAIATCGFAAFFNTPWCQMAMAADGGMAGHGTRFLALEWGLRLEAATFLGGLVVGVLSACMARSSRASEAAIAFAGAVIMIPDSSLFRALGGALQLARQSHGGSSSLAANVLAHAFQGAGSKVAH